MAGKTATLAAPFTASPKQLEAAEHWRDPDCRALLLSGAIRSGKSAAGLRLLVETALQQPSVYIVSRLTYRELEDSTKRALLHGDGLSPPLIPGEAIAEVRAGDNLVRLRNGSDLLFRSLDEPGKLLNVTAGGALIDQAEELDGGADGERIFDTLLGRLSDPRGPRKVLLIANPGPMTHWLRRRFLDPRTRDRGARLVHFALTDNQANLPPDYVEAMLASRETRPHWFRSFVLGEWGSFEGAAYEEFSEAIHVCDPFSIPREWLRFESMDHGAANPTAWLVWAVDHDSNCIVFDEYYSPGRVSAHAEEIVRRAGRWRRRGDGGQLERHYCYADPSIKASHGLTTWWGDRIGMPASVLTEYWNCKVDWLVPAVNDRAAGYSRLLELIHVERGRPAPEWSRVRPEVGGSPRLYVFNSCRHTIEQLQSAPVAADSVDAGKAVCAKWEGDHGHAHAALRYGAMSRPAPSPIVDPVMRMPAHLRPAWVDPRAFDEERALFHREHVARMDSGEGLRRTERV